MGLGLFDAQDRLRYANAFFTEALSTTLDPAPTWEEMMRRCHRDKVGLIIDAPDIDAWLARVRQTFRKNKHRTFDSDMVDGRWLRVCESAAPDGWLLITVTDITSLKANETALQQARDEAVRLAQNDTAQAIARQVELNGLKSNFVAMTSHEFRTPLASILSSTELLKYYGDRLPEQDKSDLADSIIASVKRMTQMLDKILRIGQSGAGMLHFHPAPMNVRDLCDQMLEDLDRQYPHSAARTVVDIASDAQTGMFDEKLLRHVLENLLSNALKYSPQGSEVRVAVVRDGPCTVFRISDVGIGIPPTALAHLFEPFHRATNVGDIEGTGLGLTIVKSSVELHRGTITVDSTEGQGSCFTVRIP